MNKQLLQNAMYFRKSFSQLFCLVSLEQARCGGYWYQGCGSHSLNVISRSNDFPRKDGMIHLGLVRFFD